MGAARTCLLIITIHFIHAISAQDERVPEDKRVPQDKRVPPEGFVATRGKKFIDQDDLDTYKRKLQYHFIGVKGKKNFEEPEYNLDPMSFVGMRGSKEYPMDMYLEDLGNRGGSLVGEIDYSPNDSFEVKSENPQFNDLLTQYLMRLQQERSEIPESEDEMTNEVYKRAANMHQFFGVRGKKAVKRPFDLNFRGKFIGVRGKKDLVDSGAQEIKFLVGQSGPWPKRKQMGFIGMRGKKWTDEASLENETPY